MKKIIWLLLFTILITSVCADNNLYMHDSLQLQLNLNGGFELVPEKDRSSVQTVTAELLLYPNDDYRQTVLSWESSGEVKDDKVTFKWSQPRLGTTEFGYTTTIQTNNQQLKVRNKILFPLSEEINHNYEEYLQPTETIDSDHPLIVAKATELAEGEDDLFKVVFKLASWTEENIEYDLSTLTIETSQKASWVLQNKQGVCDEISSLFIAMARSLGIPARFVSGISYSTSEQFSEPWQPHGWAEVYFPSIGWVSFDLTFGEFGYVDVTHIKLRDGFDPQESATKYEWLADSVGLEAKELSLAVKVEEKGELVPEGILIEQEILAPQVGFGSYNLIKGILRNTADHYAAISLQLAVPSEVEIIGRNRRNILLEPNGVKETSWKVKVNDNLNPNFWYEFPVLIYSEKNQTVKEPFKALQGRAVYSESEIDKLTIEDEEKTYSQKISFECTYRKEMDLGEEIEIRCEIKNRGNTNLRDLSFCLDTVCEKINLPINQKKGSKIKVKAAEVGYNKVIISADNNVVEKSEPLEYIVFDPPSIVTQVESPNKIIYGQDFQIGLNLKRGSFSAPKDVLTTLKGPGFENSWSLEQLQEAESFTFELKNFPLSKKNKFKVTTQWKDRQGNSFSEEQEIVFRGEARDFVDNIKMFFNGIIKIFS